VVPLLVAAGHPVTALGRTPGQAAARSARGDRPRRGSLRPTAVRRAVQGHESDQPCNPHPSQLRAFVPAHGGTPTAFVGGLGESLGGGARRGSWRLIQESFAPIYEAAGDRWIDEDAPVRAARYNAAYWTPKRRPSGSRVREAAGVVLRFAFFYGADSDFTQDAIRYVAAAGHRSSGPHRLSFRPCRTTTPRRGRRRPRRSPGTLQRVGRPACAETRVRRRTRGRAGCSVTQVLPRLGRGARGSLGETLSRRSASPTPSCGPPAVGATLPERRGGMEGRPARDA